MQQVGLRIRPGREVSACVSWDIIFSEPRNALKIPGLGQWLRALVALVEDPGSSPAPHGGSRLSLTPVPGDTTPSCGL